MHSELIKKELVLIKKQWTKLLQVICSAFHRVADGKTNKKRASGAITQRTLILSRPFH